MIVYEENFILDEDVKVEFAGFLTGYLERITKHKGFQYAAWFFPTDKVQTGKICWTIHFSIDSMDNLKNYLSNEAIKNQNELKSKFNEKFSLNTRTLNLLGIYGLPENINSVIEK